MCCLYCRYEKFVVVGLFLSLCLLIRMEATCLMAMLLMVEKVAVIANFVMLKLFCKVFSVEL